MFNIEMRHQRGSRGNQTYTDPQWLSHAPSLCYVQAWECEMLAMQNSMDHVIMFKDEQICLDTHRLLKPAIMDDQQKMKWSGINNESLLSGHLTGGTTGVLDWTTSMGRFADE